MNDQSSFTLLCMCFSCFELPQSRVCLFIFIDSWWDKWFQIQSCYSPSVGPIILSKSQFNVNK